ncbi:MAG: type IX secretion system outer membrane channel protein PorV [Bacteroidaceae bacterium]|nr:type IX secretion system outer membrane channel protein PorV [Bacteroidaceae bacterium]
MKRLFLLSIMTLLVCTISRADDDATQRFNPETYGVTSLSIAPDARAGSMGDMGVATEADINSQHWNAAKYPFNVARAGVAASYTPWLRKIVSDINLAAVEGFYRIGDYSALSASFRYFSLGEVTVTEGDYTIKPYEMAFDIAYSRMLTRCLSMGVTLRYIRSDMSNNYKDGSSAGNAFGADISFYREGYFMVGSRECRLAWGIAMTNIGTKINYGGTTNSEFLPTTLRLGINFLVPINEFNKISLGVETYKICIPTFPYEVPEGDPRSLPEYQQEEFYDVSPIAGIFKSFADAPGGFKEEMQEFRWCMGMEYTYNDRFMLRFGYHHENKNKGNRQYLTVGAGFHMSVFTIDAAYVFATSQTNPLDQTMRFTLGFDLDGMRDLFGKKSKRR